MATAEQRTATLKLFEGLGQRAAQGNESVIAEVRTQLDKELAEKTSKLLLQAGTAKLELEKKLRNVRAALQKAEAALKKNMDEIVELAAEVLSGDDEAIDNFDERLSKIQCSSNDAVNTANGAGKRVSGVPSFDMVPTSSLGSPGLGAGGCTRNCVHRARH